LISKLHKVFISAENRALLNQEGKASHINWLVPQSLQKCHIIMNTTLMFFQNKLRDEDQTTS